MKSLLILFLIYTLHPNEANDTQVRVTLHHQDVYTFFNENEIFDIRFTNRTSDIVQVEVVIDHSKLTKIISLNSNKILKTNVILSDVQQAIYKERARINNTPEWNTSMLPDLFFIDYRTWPQYIAFLVLLEERFPNLVSINDLGQTYEGRIIPMVTLSTGGTNKPGLYIQAVVHAREWLANSATMYILNALAEGYNTNESITNILNVINIYIVPTVNVDGYVYSWETERLWRKNRRDNGGGIYGVDLNRNYGVGFGGPGSSSDPSSNTYRGIQPFSEPETAATRDCILNATNNIQAMFDMHTYGNYILYPWAYTFDPVTPPSEYERLSELGAQQQAAIESVHGQVYESIQAVDMYIASGYSIDWV